MVRVGYFLCVLLAIGSATASPPQVQGVPDTSVNDVYHLSGPLIAAHRGGFFGAPNTLRQFMSTIHSGDADILEMDLQSTRDGIVVVFHDPDLHPNTDCSGELGAQTYGQIRNCTHRDGSVLPLFDDVLQATAGKTLLDAEFKTNEVIEPAIQLTAARHADGQVYFQLGNDRHKYAIARGVSSEVALQYKATSDDDIAWAASLNDPNLILIEMSRDFISPGRVRAVHAAGKLVSENSWRYQYTEERFGASCTLAFSQGVDVVVTNNPMSCKRERYLPAYGPFHRWAYDIGGRQHVRRAMRAISNLETSTLIHNMHLSMSVPALAVIAVLL